MAKTTKKKTAKVKVEPEGQAHIKATFNNNNSLFRLIFLLIHYLTAFFLFATVFLLPFLVLELFFVF